MKTFISIITLFLCIYGITSQIDGNWTTSWQNNAAACCSPNSIIINPIANSSQYQISYSFPANYTANNSYCIAAEITGNFVDNLTLTANTSEALTFSDSIYEIKWAQVLSAFSATLNASDECTIFFVPSNSNPANLTQYSSQYSNTIWDDLAASNFSSTFNGTNSTSVTDCCIPNSIEIVFNSTQNINLYYNYGSQANTNPWCIANNISNTTVQSSNVSIVGNSVGWTAWNDTSTNNIIILTASTVDSIAVLYNAPSINGSCEYGFIAPTPNNTHKGSAKIAISFIFISFILACLW